MIRTPCVPLHTRCACQKSGGEIAAEQRQVMCSTWPLGFRVRDGIQNMYRCLRTTANITRDKIESCEFVEGLIDTNQAFLKTIPNSVQYWADRKRDLFSMICQLGKPTAFLTLSANKTLWPHLHRIPHRLSDEYESLSSDIY